MGQAGVPSTNPADLQAQQQFNDQVYPRWIYDTLKQIGATPNPVNTKALYVWSQGELGSIPATHNPLAITAPVGDLTMWGTVGTAKPVANYGKPGNAVAPGQWNVFSNGRYSVLTFPTESRGVQALAEFLQNGHTDIIQALSNPNASLYSIGQAVNSDGGWAHDGDLIIKAERGSTVVNSRGQTTGPGKGNDSGSSTFYQCSSDHVIIGTPGVIGSLGKFNILNACQAKALMGGLTVGLGVIIMGAGVAVLVSGAAVGAAFSSTLGRIQKAGGEAQKAVLGDVEPPTVTTTAPPAPAPAKATTAPTPPPAKPKPEGVTIYKPEPPRTGGKTGQQQREERAAQVRAEREKEARRQFIEDRNRQNAARSARRTAQARRGR